MALNPRTLAVGLGWMAFGIVVYVLYRRNQKLPLTETVKVVTPEPLGVEEIEYRSVLVAFEDGEPFSEEMVATAVKLASKRRRGIHIHSMLTVPTDLPLDAELRDQEAEAQSKIEQAKLIGGQRVTGHVERVRPGAGRLLDLRRGEADQRRRGRRRAALPRRRAALRQDPADRARRAALPRDRRLRPQRAAVPRRPRRSPRLEPRIARACTRGSVRAPLHRLPRPRPGDPRQHLRPRRRPALARDAPRLGLPRRRIAVSGYPALPRVARGGGFGRVSP